MAELTSLGAVIKATYEGEPDTNAFTDEEKSKLAAIDLESIGAVYDSVAAVKELNIPPDITAFRTNGYNAPGDGGGALYVEGDEGPGAIQSGDGRWWAASVMRDFSTFSTVADVQNSHIPAVLESIRTFGRDAPGDGEGGIYVDQPNGSARTLQSLEGKTWYRASINRRRYVDVGDFCQLDDTKEAYSAVQAALNEGEGREIVFSNPAGGRRYYRCRSRGNGRLTLPRRTRLIFEPGAFLDFEDYGRPTDAGTPYLWARGELGPEILLTDDAPDGATSLTLPSGGGAGFSAGDVIFVRSAAFFTLHEGSRGTQGEWATVSHVEGDTVHIMAALRADYLVSDGAYVTLVDPVEVTVENPQILGAGRPTSENNGDRGIWIVNGHNCHVIGGYIQLADFQSIAFQNVLNGTIEGTRIVHGPREDTDARQYGVAYINMCENVWAENADVVGGNESYCLTVSGQPQGITRDVGFRACRARGAWRSGFCSHHNHESWTVTDCIIQDCEQGIDHRVRKGTFTGNRFERLGHYSGNLSVALQLGRGAGEFIFEGNWINGARCGVEMPARDNHGVQPGDMHIINNRMRNISQYGVRIEDSEGNDFARGLVRVKDNAISGPTYGVRIAGNWHAQVCDNDFLSGVGRSVWLAPSDGGGSVGPRNVLVKGNSLAANVNPPLYHSVQSFASGTELVGQTTTTPPEINAGDWTSIDIPVTGASLGDRAEVGMTTYRAGVYITAQVSSDGSVRAWIHNHTGNPISLGSRTFWARVTTQ